LLVLLGLLVLLVLLGVLLLLVLFVSFDMGKGKIAAQVGHACVLGAENVRKSHPDWFKEWWDGQEKVVVKVSSLKEWAEFLQDKQ
jgi:PTH2 family peptidyl-tRNA hydrolase